MTAGYLPSAPSWRPFPSPFWIFVESPKDIWSCVCTPHVQELPVPSPRSYLALALAPSIVLLEGAGEQLPKSDGSPPHTWDLKALASGFFVDGNL